MQPAAPAVDSTETSASTSPGNAAGNPLLAVLKMGLTYIGFALAILNFSNVSLVTSQ